MKHKTYKLITALTALFLFCSISTFAFNLALDVSLGIKNASRVSVDGRYAYVATKSGRVVKIINVTNPKSPNSVSALETNNALDVAVVGDYAYVADGKDGLKIFDITKPIKPVFIGGLKTSFASSVIVIKNLAYVADGAEGLKIINISDPTKPNLVKAIKTDSALDVAVVGDYAYVADGYSGLKIISIKDPTYPKIVGGLKTNWALGIAVVGNYAYVADKGKGLVIIDVADPINQFSDVTVFSSYNISSVAVVGNYAYITDEAEGSKIIDVTKPANPKLVENGSSKVNSAVDVSVVGNYAYVVSSEGLKIINLGVKLKSIEITPKKTNIIKEFTQQFIVTGIYEDVFTKDITNLVSWDFDEKIVGINESGVVTALEIGETNISAKIKENGEEVTSQIQKITTIDISSINDINLLLELAARSDASPNALIAIMQHPISDLNVLRAVFANQNVDRDTLLSITKHNACDFELSHRVFAHPLFVANPDINAVIDQFGRQYIQQGARFNAIEERINNMVIQQNAHINEIVEQQNTYFNEVITLQNARFMATLEQHDNALRRQMERMVIKIVKTMK